MKETDWKKITIPVFFFIALFLMKQQEEIIEKFENCVKALIELESMKAANYERMSRGEALAYHEDAILSLIDKI